MPWASRDVHLIDYQIIVNNRVAAYSPGTELVTMTYPPDSSTCVVTRGNIRAYNASTGSISEGDCNKTFTWAAFDVTTQYPEGIK
ncbi:MAG: hypothetical protein EP343_09355 [Deltaproteobacteria bacterium]|nr:MAG: hypothetical protein EP343_09355 [Deltaproteobacteria bacterium]